VKRVLHAGCGGEPLPPEFGECEEVRLDITNDNNPDFVGSITDLKCVGDQRFDAVYCSHTLEHVYPHEAKKVLSEFHRVLNDKGMLWVNVPNLEGLEVSDKVVYESPSGPITALDMIYGHHKLIEGGMSYMAHHCGFTEKILEEHLKEAGFSQVIMKQSGHSNLIGIGVK
jgi:predicted SAM-dependent methyltransferase